MIYAIMGKSSTGKTSILKKLIERNNYTPIITTTTRPKREKEVNNVDYNFTTEHMFDKMNKEGKLIGLFEATNGWKYGIEKDSIDITKNNLIVIEPKGYKDIVDFFGKNNVKSILVESEIDIRLLRCIERNDHPDEIERRFDQDNKDFKKIEVDFKVKNNSDLMESVEKIENFIEEDSKKKLILTSKLPPSVNNYLRYKVSRSGRRQFVQSYPSLETKQYENYFLPYVQEEIKKQNWIKPEKGKIVFVNMTLYLDRKRKDPNNLLKLPIDVLTDSGVWVDDDVVLPRCERVYIDSKNPRIEMEIYESDFVGVFNNLEELESFKKNNCDICSKDIKKCSIFKRLLDNRIIDEADKNICKKRK